ncbi:hypothetical protein G9G39_06250 [Cronobacter sp. EKM101R]|uniref:hypothetical protein n=1 Tax=unclassified Cronobacter TaxID=2649764 RepID=UPI0013EE29FB|nr:MULTISPECIES: hypothetical protein [unclassified Cronobacter]KAF6596662.1 hypothetical protein G9G39_06250 [Cronobacter sp. EKM101R]KAF6599488.1 hypothetical protein G9G38_05885 [Cronobacter sp. EKM102R]
MSEFVKSLRRNQHGVKSSCDTWRTFNGQLYEHFTSCDAELVSEKLRSAGIRCRRVGCELYVHQNDIEKAVVL